MLVIGCWMLVMEWAHFDFSPFCHCTGGPEIALGARSQAHFCANVECQKREYFYNLVLLGLLLRVPNVNTCFFGFSKKPASR